MGGRYKDGNKFEEDQRNVDQLSSNLRTPTAPNWITSIERVNNFKLEFGFKMMHMLRTLLKNLRSGYSTYESAEEPDRIPETSIYNS